MRLGKKGAEAPGAASKPGAAAPSAPTAAAGLAAVDDAASPKPPKRRSWGVRLAGWCFGILALALGVLIALLYGAPGVIGSQLNSYQAKGEIAAPGLQAPASIRRDVNGTPYVFAATFRDAIFGQGFAVGQDRLFQMEAIRRFARGELSEVFGDISLPYDRMARTMGFRRHAERRLEKLDAPSRAELDAFAAGLNAFIAARPEDLPQEFMLIGIERPRDWTALDLMSIVYAQSYYFSTPMLDAEIIAQGLMEHFDGNEKLAEAYFPYVENPDDPGSGAARDALRVGTTRDYADLDLDLRATLFGEAPGAPFLSAEATGAGSNNWAFSGSRTGGAAIFANDPHLDVRRLPGPWHPVGLFTEDGVRAVGANIGLPGIVVGRNAKTAFGVTIGFMDNVDLYVEEIDPERPGFYREGDDWVRARSEDEPIGVLRDGEIQTEEYTVLITPRGPILPDFGLVGAPDKALSVRWSLASDAMANRAHYRFEPLLRAESAAEAVSAMERLAEVALNFVSGDVEGGVARRSTGFLPDRAEVDGLTPQLAGSAQEAWAGFLSGAQLPGERDPEAGWTGSANHAVAPAEYGRTFSDLVSPAHRYERMKALFDPPGPLDRGLATQAQRDVANLHAERMVPLILKALETAAEPEAASTIAAEILREWDRRDEGDQSAPLIFQEIVREAAIQLHQPALGPALAERMLKRREFWQERFEQEMLAGEGLLLERAGFDGPYGRDVLLRRATKAAMATLERLHGPDPRRWRWSNAMQVRFEGPLPTPKDWEGVSAPLGLRYEPISGSGETLDRAHSEFFRPDPLSPLEAVDSAASIRVVVDLNDSEKVAATLAGGVSGRTLHPHLDNQIEMWRRPSGSEFWWFSRQAIEDNTISTLRLTPAE